MNAIIVRLMKIDAIFEEHKNDETFYKTDLADSLRTEWVSLYNRLASQGAN